MICIHRSNLTCVAVTFICFPDVRLLLSGWVAACSRAGDTLEVQEPEGVVVGGGCGGGDLRKSVAR